MHKSTNNSENLQKNLKGFNSPLFRLSDFNKKKVEASFSAEQVSNDGGLLLLNEVEKQIGLVEKLAGCIHDPRWIFRSILTPQNPA
jgi:hypothetical protein